jgi:hypothetical protein
MIDNTKTQRIAGGASAGRACPKRPACGASPGKRDAKRMP